MSPSIPPDPEGGPNASAAGRPGVEDVPEATPNFFPAYKHGWPRLAVDRLIRSRLRSGLNRIRVQGIEGLRDHLRADRSGVLLVANHSCWWDIFLAHYLNEAIPVDGYGMMMHESLRKFGFFRRIGAYSVERSDPSAIRDSLRYTRHLLAQEGTGVWIFPQGEIICNDVRPLGFRPGLRGLLRISGRLRVVPVALRFEFWQEERPEAFARFGEPEWIGRERASEVVAHCEARLVAELDLLREDVLHQRAERFTDLMTGRTSIHESYDRLRRRALGLIGLGKDRPVPPTTKIKHQHEDDPAEMRSR